MLSIIISGIVGTGAAALVAAVDRSSGKPASRTPNGWKQLRPGWLLGSTVAGCGGLACLALYFLLIGGSARADAAMQNLGAALFAAFFGTATTYLVWLSYGRTILWKDDLLRIVSWPGRETAQRFADVTSVALRPFLGEYVISFRDGSKLHVSGYMEGADELLHWLTPSQTRIWR